MPVHSNLLARVAAGTSTTSAVLVVVNVIGIVFGRSVGCCCPTGRVLAKQIPMNVEQPPPETPQSVAKMNCETRAKGERANGRMTLFVTEPKVAVSLETPFLLVCSSTKQPPP